MQRTRLPRTALLIAVALAVIGSWIAVNKASGSEPHSGSVGYGTEAAAI